MSIIEPPPNLQRMLPNDPSELLNISSNQEVRELISKANEHYIYWDKLKYRQMPPGIPAEKAWAYLKMNRLLNAKPAPFTDKSGGRFSFWVPGSLLKALNAIDRQSGQVIQADHHDLPSQERYIISMLMEEAIASSQLEGAATTHRIAKEMLRSGREPQDKHEQMIVNNWRTMKFLRENRQVQLSTNLILEIHKMITDKTLENPSEAGRFREADDVLVRYGGETVHEPPRFQIISARTEALCRFANDDHAGEWIHPVIKAAMLHFWLAYDHPFTDGNGRTARALFYWYLLSRGYWLFEYLPISKYFLQAPGRYVRAYLYTETDGGDLTYFLAYNLRVIRIALRDLYRYIAEKQRQMSVANELLGKYRDLNHRQKALIYHAIRYPETRYTIESHRNSQGIAYDSARNDLLTLEKRGFLKRERQGRTFVFVPTNHMIRKLKRGADMSRERL